MINTNFQNSLKKYRKARKLTQDELGTILGVSGQTIYKYENGVTFPPADTLEKILDYFKIDPNTLFAYKCTTDDKIEEIKNLLENHKRLHQEFGYFTGATKGDDLLDSLTDNYPEIKDKLSKENLFYFQRYILLENIKKIVGEMEEESYIQRVRDGAYDYR